MLYQILHCYPEENSFRYMKTSPLNPGVMHQCIIVSETIVGLPPGSGPGVDLLHALRGSQITAEKWCCPAQRTAPGIEQS